MGKVNYKQLFAIQKRLEEKVKKACPVMEHKPGIYVYSRTDEDGKQYGYIGKSVDCLKRCVQHMQGYQRIDLSLRKRGFYDKEQNPYGWELKVFYCEEKDLDINERAFIRAYKHPIVGIELYNIESGGTTGKTIIGERKPAKGYRDGVEQGKKQIRKELSALLDKYLIVDLKKQGKLAENALEKFNKLVYGGK